MKKFLLAGAAVAALSTTAFAADLPRKTAPMAPMLVPTFTWTGFYVGANAGYGFNTNDNNNNVFAVPTATASIPGFGVPTNFFGSGGSNGNRSRDGFVGGGQVGYNYQFGAGSGFVIGIEADYQYADFGRNNNNNGFIGAVTPAGLGVSGVLPVGISVIDNGTNGGRGLESFGTARARIGYAFDRVLVYGTGGVAFTADSGNKNSTSFGSVFTTNAAGTSTFLGNAALFNSPAQRDDVGYAVGGGLEYAFTNNLTAKIEGLYVNFGSKNSNNNGFNSAVNFNGTTFVGTTTTVTNTSRSRDTEFAVVRAGLNYKFSFY